MPFEITFGNLRQEVSADFVPTPEVDAEFETYIGGGGIIPTGEISITANGNYNVYQYATAKVNVPGVTPTGTKSISIYANGTTTEDVTAYANAEITVNVPASAVDTGTKTINISANGTTTEDVVGYANAQIVVAVPVPVLDSLTATDNGTYTPTTGHAYSSVVVAIPSASGVLF